MFEHIFFYSYHLCLEGAGARRDVHSCFHGYGVLVWAFGAAQSVKAEDRMGERVGDFGCWRKEKGERLFQMWRTVGG